MRALSFVVVSASLVPFFVNGQNETDIFSTTTTTTSSSSTTRENDGGGGLFDSTEITVNELSVCGDWTGVSIDNVYVRVDPDCCNIKSTSVLESPAECVSSACSINEAIEFINDADDTWFEIWINDVNYGQSSFRLHSLCAQQTSDSLSARYDYPLSLSISTSRDGDSCSHSLSVTVRYENDNSGGGGDSSGGGGGGISATSLAIIIVTSIGGLIVVVLLIVLAYIRHKHGLR